MLDYTARQGTLWTLGGKISRCASEEDLENFPVKTEVHVSSVHRRPSITVSQGAKENLRSSYSGLVWSNYSVANYWIPPHSKAPPIFFLTSPWSRSRSLRLPRSHGGQALASWLD